MTSKSDMITMRETLQIHWRAFKDIRRYCPGAFGVSVLYGTAAALSPYVTVYLSARIINELAGARPLEVLGPLAILAVASGALLTFVLGNAYYFGVAYFSFFYSYRNGLKVIRDMNRTGILDRLMESATILGMTAVGALIPSWVGFSLESEIQIGDYVLNLQQELDNIIPGLAPLALTVLLAWLYRKNISSLKLAALIFVFSLIFSLIL